jgi:hypothetical protein
MPVLLLLVLGILTSGLWLYARMGAATAAATAADGAAAASSDPEHVRKGAVTLAEQAGLADVTVSITHASGTVTAVVSGRAVMPLSLGFARIREQAVRPAEVVTRP